MLARLVFLLGVIAAMLAGFFFGTFFGLHYVLAHDGIHDKWFAAQLVPPGNDNAGLSCCNHSDGHVLEEDDWRIAEGHYQFRFGNGWVAIEDSRVLPYDGANPSNPDAQGNPLGKPVVWYLTHYEGGQVTPSVYCFKAGTES